MSWDRNPYYNPEKFDLEIVDELDVGEPYSFDMIVVWRHKDGTIYWNTDSGCSCPSPFEWVDDISHLETLDPNDYSSVRRFVESVPMPHFWRDSSTYDIDTARARDEKAKWVAEVLRKVRRRG